MRRHRLLLALVPMFILGVAADALATVRLPSDAAQRNAALADVKELCRDYGFSASQDQAGTWTLTKGSQIEWEVIELTYNPTTDSWRLGTATVTSNQDPNGCALVCQAIASSKTITIRYINLSGASPSCTTNDPTAGSDPMQGSDSTVTMAADGGGYDVLTYRQQDLDASGEANDCSSVQPSWLTLGHELVHALRSANGQHVANNAQEERETVGPENPQGAGPHLTENGCRKDKGMDPRVQALGNCGAIEAKVK